MKVEFGYLATAAAVSMNFIDEINAVITTITLLATLIFWVVKNVRLLRQKKDPDLKPPIPANGSPNPIIDRNRGEI